MFTNSWSFLVGFYFSPHRSCSWSGMEKKMRGRFVTILCMWSLQPPCSVAVTESKYCKVEDGRNHVDFWWSISLRDKQCQSPKLLTFCNYIALFHVHSCSYSCQSKPTLQAELVFVLDYSIDRTSYITWSPSLNTSMNGSTIILFVRDPVFKYGLLEGLQRLNNSAHNFESWKSWLQYVNYSKIMILNSFI